MADPNSSPVSAPSGELASPDFSNLSGDVASIESDFEPRIQQSEAHSQDLEGKAVAASEEAAGEAEKEAGELTAEDQEMQHWVDHTPTRQAAYATSMHAAPVLSILTALGGKLTKLNGMQMLAATNGIVQGLNEASEKKYQDAMNAWQSAYEKMRDHQRRLMDAHRMMLTAYQGRADAYQKASDAARRMTGDLLDDKQRKIAETVDTFKAQQAAVDKLNKINLAREALHERVLKDIAQEKHWQEVDQKTSQMPADVKAQVAAEKSRWTNAKAQIDKNMQRRGQISSNLNMAEDMKSSLIQRIDDEDQALRMEMDKSQSNTDALIAGYVARKNASGGGSPAPGAAASNGGQPPGSATPDNPRGAAGRPGEPPAQASDTAPAGGDKPSQGKLAALQQHKGKAVTFADNSVWIMDDSGVARRVQ
jgi:hypothetical protein